MLHIAGASSDRWVPSGGRGEIPPPVRGRRGVPPLKRIGLSSVAHRNRPSPSGVASPARRTLDWEAAVPLGSFLSLMEWYVVPALDVSNGTDD